MDTTPPLPRHITIIAAVAENGAIGFENRLLYSLPADLQRFKCLTTGHTVIMGRRTYESLPHGALPHRRNIVLSRSARASCPGCEVFASLTAALAHCAIDEEVYIIGGGQVYRQALPYATRLCQTLVHTVPAAADTFFPAYADAWQEVWREEHAADERHAVAYAFADYERRC